MEELEEKPHWFLFFRLKPGRLRIYSNQIDLIKTCFFALFLGSFEASNSYTQVAVLFVIGIVHLWYLMFVRPLEQASCSLLCRLEWQLSECAHPGG